MARRRNKESRELDKLGASLARGAIAGCAVAGAVVFGIVFMIGIIIAIRFNEMRRHGQGPFAQPPKIEIDPPGDPPPVNPPANMNPRDKVGKDGLMRTNIVGGAFHPEFEDKAPPGGVLIGLELAVVKDEGIKSICPIYLVQGKEVKGTQVGTEKPNIVLKAKNGYAVSALNVNAGLWLNIISLTFARMNNGKLNPNDTYQSPSYGEPGGSPSVHGGNGMNVVGVIGKRSKGDNSACGIGLLLK